MTRNNHRLFSAPAVVLLAFAAAAAFITALLYGSCGEAEPTSTPSASASPTAATSTKSPAPANQTSPGAAQSNAETPKQTEVKIPAITGIVRKEGSGQAVTEAVVVLFTGDKRGSPPKLVDASSGEFKFQDVPLKAGITYSLQTKVPGLCGEENFSLESVNAQQPINRDIILKPCQNQVAIQQTPPKSEEPGLTRISDGLSGMAAPLNTVKVWIQILATTWIFTLVILFIATLGYIIPIRRQVAESRKRIDLLYDSQKRIEPDAQKQTPAPSTTLLNLPPDVSQTLKQVVAALEKIATVSPRTIVQTHEYPEGRDGPRQQPLTDTTPVYAAPSHSSSPQPTEWYEDLLRGQARNPAPLFVEINDNSSENDPLFKRRICFDERDHGAFVVFRESDATGWIFPRPNSTVLADHHRVFGKLESKNFEQPEPKPVIFQDGFWQLQL